jgi:hypothetical protein
VQAETTNDAPDTQEVEMENPTATHRDIELDRIAQQRNSLKSRHASALAKLMIEREDLRGAHAFADFVDDSVRWSA